MKNKNILELCLSDGLGGLELFVVSCYDEFSQHTNCKIVVAPHTKLATYLENKEVFTLSRNKFFPFIPALKLAKYIDKNEIDIIHFHWTRDIITAVLAKLLSKKKPKIVQSRHMTMTRFKDDFYHRWIYKNLDMIHGVTAKLKGELEKFIPADVRPTIQMVYLGTKVPNVDKAKVKTLFEKHRFEDAFVVGIVGRIEEEKGQYKLLEVLAKLKNLNIKLCIVGSAMDQEYLEKLKDRVLELDLTTRVIFTGFTKDVNEYLQLFDVNVLATNNETFGLVVIETMVNKTAILATNKGGPLEIIEDRLDGLLFNGSVEDAEEKIKLLYDNPSLKKNLAEAGYKKVREKFDTDKQLMELFNVIQKV